MEQKVNSHSTLRSNGDFSIGFQWNLNIFRLGERGEEYLDLDEVVVVVGSGSYTLINGVVLCDPIPYYHIFYHSCDVPYRGNLPYRTVTWLVFNRGQRSILLIISDRRITTYTAKSVK